jgi:hypothetical protein
LFTNRSLFTYPISFVDLEKPEVRNLPSYQEVQVLRSFHLKLDYEAIPPPSFQWFRNGYSLPDQTTKELYIPATSLQDSGTYSCRVWNIAGDFLWLEATLFVRE